jgi:hypothetical protein
MKPILLKIHANRAPNAERISADDNLGRGMDIALTLLVFLGAGWFVDRWLGVFPLVTIALVLIASVGIFVRLKYTYELTMQRLETERAAQRQPTSQAVATTATSKDAR